MIGTSDCVYICDITAFLLVILQLAANSELRQKVLDLVLILRCKVLVLVLTKKSYLQDWKILAVDRVRITELITIY